VWSGYGTGFAARNLRLSWVSPEKWRQVIFVAKSLPERGPRQFVPGKAEYDLSYHCPARKLYVSDYSRSLSRAEAKAVAETMRHHAS
jgi:hypothetical protein